MRCPNLSVCNMYRPFRCATLSSPPPAYRKPFVPPDASQPLVVRSISYGGEPHPAAAKRTIVVPVARLPLNGEAAIHKFKVLAGVRWTPDPPTDSGINAEESGGEHGYFSRLGYRDLHARRVAAARYMEDAEEWTSEWSQVVRVKVGAFLVDLLMDVATVVRTVIDRRTGDVL